MLLILILAEVIFKTIGIDGYRLNSKPTNFFDNLLNYEDYIGIVIIFLIISFFFKDE